MSDGDGREGQARDPGPPPRGGVDPAPGAALDPAPGAALDPAPGAALDPALRAALGPSRIHHVALVVRSIDGSLGLWRDRLGLAAEAVMEIPSDGVSIAFLQVGESKVELVEPTDPSTGVARFLDAKGEGFHHVCLEVADLAAELDRLGAAGVELIDRAPRRGAEGPVAFIHPRSGGGVLVELIEARNGPAWRALGFAAPGPQAGAAR